MGWGVKLKDIVGFSGFLPMLGDHQPNWSKFGKKGYEARGFNMGGLADESSGAYLNAYDDALGGNQPPPLMGNSSPDWLNIGAANSGDTEERGFNMGGLADELGGVVPQGAEAMGLGAVPGMLEESGGFGPGVSEGMELPESASLKDIADMMSREQVAAIIEEVRMALSGEHPQGEQLLSIVAEMFGPEFIQQISQTFAAVSEQGVSDGMSDSIPASLGNEQIAVSEGEYIVPAREVASLGNGSSDAGGRALDRMIQEIRAAATGSPEAAPPIDPSDFLGGSIG